MKQRFLTILKTINIYLITYPFMLIIQMPIAWIKTLKRSLILFNGRWSRFMGHNPNNALNSLFYRTQLINIDKYGKNGTSTHIGLGNFAINRWFHLSLMSSYAYAHAGAVTTLLGTIFWALSHLIWFQRRDLTSIIILIVVLVLSSTSYSFAFARQNYQILSWMWLPVALYSMLSLNWTIASFSWFMTAIFGTTTVFFAIPIALFIALDTQTIPPILSILPAVVVVIVRMYPLLRTSSMLSSLNNTAKLIGLTRKHVKYKRFHGFIGFTTVYYIIIYLFATLALWYLDQSIPKLAMVGFALFIINQAFIRVADIQSVNLLFISLFICSILYEANYWSSIPLLWLVTSVHPIVLGIMNRKSNNVQVYAPFDHNDLEMQLTSFIQRVNSRDRILFAFSDPQNNYDDIFDRYRILIELPLYIASKRAIHLMPDWYAVMDTNYIDAPNIWGRSIDSVIENLHRWNASHVIIYESANTPLDSQWTDHFDHISTFSWVPYTNILRDHRIIPDDIDVPVWYLLKYRSDVHSSIERTT